MRFSSLVQDAFLEVDTKGNGAISLDELRNVSIFSGVCVYGCVCIRGGCAHFGAVWVVLAGRLLVI